MRFPMCLALLVVVVKCQGEANVSVVTRFYKDVLENYDKRVRPVMLQSQAVQVFITFAFTGLRNFDDLSGKAEFLSSFTLRWKEDRITWNKSDNDFVDHIVLPADDVWTPELIMINYPDLNNAPGRNGRNVRIQNNGDASMSSLDLLKTICSVDITKYPFDRQICSIFITPWGFTSSEIDLREDNNSMKSLVEPDTESNSAWLLRDISLSVTSKATYSGLQITIEFERRSLYVIANLLIPIFTLGFLNPWVFLLPQESGERMSFSITVLLSFAVYMGILSDNMPKGSQPLADVNYLMICMVMYSAAILLLTIISLRIYNNDGKRDVPKYSKYCMKILCCHNKCTTSKVKATDIRQQKWVETINTSKTQNLIINNEPRRASSVTLHDKDIIREIETERGDRNERVEVTWIEIGKVFDYCAFVFAMVLWGAQLLIEYRISLN